MADRVAALFAAIPEWVRTPISLLAILAALAGSGLMLLAAAYGDYTPALWSGAAFAAAGLLWQIADRASQSA